MRRCAPTFVAGLSFAAALGGAARADDDASRRPLPSIVVEGTATRDVAPDMAVVTLGVTTDRPKAQDAARDNGKTVKGLVDEIAATGVPATDVATVRATLSPLYDTPKNGDTPRLRGFRATNTVEIRLRKLETAGDLAGRLVDLGANELQGIDLGVSDPEPILDDLRAEAARNAKHRAELYADALGVKLGSVMLIQPETGAMPMERAFKTAMPAPMAATSVPVAAGTQKFEARVSVTFALVIAGP